MVNGAVSRRRRLRELEALSPEKLPGTAAESFPNDIASRCGRTLYLGPPQTGTPSDRTGDHPIPLRDAEQSPTGSKKPRGHARGDSTDTTGIGYRRQPVTPVMEQGDLVRRHAITQSSSRDTRSKLRIGHQRVGITTIHNFAHTPHSVQALLIDRVCDPRGAEPARIRRGAVNGTTVLHPRKDRDAFGSQEEATQRSFLTVLEAHDDAPVLL